MLAMPRSGMLGALPIFVRTMSKATHVPSKGELRARMHRPIDPENMGTGWSIDSTFQDKYSGLVLTRGLCGGHARDLAGLQRRTLSMDAIVGTVGGYFRNRRA